MSDSDSSATDVARSPMNSGASETPSSSKKDARLSTGSRRSKDTVSENEKMEHVVDTSNAMDIEESATHSVPPPRGSFHDDEKADPADLYRFNMKYLFDFFCDYAYQLPSFTLSWYVVDNFFAVCNLCCRNSIAAGVFAVYVYIYICLYTGTLCCVCEMVNAEWKAEKVSDELIEYWKLSCLIPYFIFH